MTTSHKERPWPGRFITFEGGEGAGKSTQAKLLADRLIQLDQTVILTREPGGVTQGEELRALLLSGARDRWTPISEALLMYAARVEHWRLKVEPALRKGHWVISDRFADSSMAYQGIAGGVGHDAIMSLHKFALGAVKPDFTVVLDVHPETGLQRAAARVAAQGEDATRFEHMDQKYHTTLAQAFRDIAAEDPHRCVVIPASAAADTIAKQIWTLTQSRLGPIP